MAEVRVKVVVPRQEFYFWYDEDEWTDAVNNDEIEYLMDHDLSDLEVQEEVYGPDDKLVDLW